MGLAWAASPAALIRYTLLGVVSSAMPPVSVYLGATLVNRIAEARLHAITFRHLVPVLFGLWAVTALQRPDFRTIATFRRRHLPALRALFQQVLGLCQRAGLVRLGHVALDGTKIRANASKLSHAELDEAETLDEGDPAELAAAYRELSERLPSLSVFGGCCGTDHRHVEAIAGVVTP